MPNPKSRHRLLVACFAIGGGSGRCDQPLQPLEVGEDLGFEEL
jgi:hypothetical protein